MDQLRIGYETHDSGDVMKNKRKKHKATLLVLVIILAFMAGLIYRDNTLLTVSHYTVKSERLPQAFNAFRILQLSDLHSASFGEDNTNLLAEMEAQNPHIVVLTGDMVNTGDEDFDVFLTFANALGRLYDTYYIVGNHEQNLEEDKQQGLLKEITDMGITVLDNEKLELDRNGDKIDLYGMWFNLRYYKDSGNPHTKDISFDADTMEKIMGSKNSTRFSLLLTHNPLYFNTYAQWGADLTLAGHIHGGMIRIPFVGGLLSPEREFFSKYSEGQYFIDTKSMIVNRGLGNGDFGIRLFNRPEISVITLLKDGQ